MIKCIPLAIDLLYTSMGIMTGIASLYGCTILVQYRRPRINKTPPLFQGPKGESA
ncbi:hypothetical protein KRR40_31105 [Niabella defluvii]|nr:hypothetical protein KRR40_31105 [Niabella sp. I65]